MKNKRNVHIMKVLYDLGQNLQQASLNNVFLSQLSVMALLLESKQPPLKTNRDVSSLYEKEVKDVLLYQGHKKRRNTL